jgi:hypothetical protein
MSKSNKMVYISKFSSVSYQRSQGSERDPKQRQVFALGSPGTFKPDKMNNLEFLED